MELYNYETLPSLVDSPGTASAIYERNFVDYPRNISLHELISATAARRTDAVAVRFESIALTFKELDEAANRLAHYFVMRGVCHGATVAVAIEWSHKTVITLLAIMKAGAAYLPIDLDYPDARIEFVLKDAEVPFIFTHAGYLDRFQYVDCKIVAEEAFASLADFPATCPDVPYYGDEVAYVLYTSGSTGNPKGVQVKVQGLVNFLISMQRAPGMCESEKMLAQTTISFDIAGLELFLPLLCGAEIVMVARAIVKDPSRLLEFMRTGAANIVQATPALWRLLIEAGWNERFPIKILCGGEALTAHLAADLLQRCDELWNMYGPTETTIWSTIDRVTDSNDVSIGKPINNTTIYLLDESMRPVASGEIGEIYIGGDGVARGYINRPEQNEARFLQDPFAGTCAKMYRTGDLGRLADDGRLLYVGRADNQVKVRGQRIEPEEVEAYIGRLAGIKEVIATVYDDSLLAYATLHSGANISGWRKLLKDQLPSHMIPSDILVIDHFELTPNGKIDRKKLPTPEKRKLQAESIAQATTATQKLLVSIWEEVLNVTPIGIHDDFFELGGHSFTAIQVVTSIEKLTRTKLPLAALVEAPTIAKLAALLDSGCPNSVRTKSLVAIKPTGSKVPLYIVHGYGMNVLSFTGVARNMDADQPVYGLQAIGLDGTTEPLGKLEDIAAHYVADIIAHDDRQDYALGGYSFGGTIALEMARQLQTCGKRVVMLAMFDAYNGSGQNVAPMHIKFVKKIWRQFPKINFIARALMRHPVEVVGYQFASAAKRVLSVLNGGKRDTSIHAQIDKVIGTYEQAYNNYQMQEYDGSIDLFRVRKRLYFVDDMEYLGWKPFARKGVRVHGVSGDHRSFLMAPYDKEFARALQAQLDACTKC